MKRSMIIIIFITQIKTNTNLNALNRKDIDNSVGMAPAVYLEQVNKKDINYSQKFSIQAFDLFPNEEINMSQVSDSYRNSIYINEAFDESYNPLSIDDSDNIDLNNSECQNSLAKEQDIYYAIESYQDLVGDGIDLFKGQDVSVSS